MSFLDGIHGGYIYLRRVRVLSDQLAQALPRDAKVLDVGCGDGLISKLILEHRPDVKISGIDVLVRPSTHIIVTQFDGTSIPFPDNSFDAVMFSDVLHHTNDPAVLIREAARVASKWVVIKDHLRDGILAGPTLRFMDWIGNARHGVVLPYNYWPKEKWMAAFRASNLEVEVWNEKMPLYPFWASWVFGRGLHFVARLGKSNPTAAATQA